MTDENESDEMKEWRAKIEAETRWANAGWAKLFGKSLQIVLFAMLVLSLGGLLVRVFGPLGYVVFLVGLGIFAFGGKSKKKE